VAWRLLPSVVNTWYYLVRKRIRVRFFDPFCFEAAKWSRVLSVVLNNSWQRREGHIHCLKTLRRIFYAFPFFVVCSTGDCRCRKRHSLLEKRLAFVRVKRHLREQASFTHYTQLASTQFLTVYYRLLWGLNSFPRIVVKCRANFFVKSLCFTKNLKDCKSFIFSGNVCISMKFFLKLSEIKKFLKVVSNSGQIW